MTDTAPTFRNVVSLTAYRTQDRIIRTYHMTTAPFVPNTVVEAICGVQCESAEPSRERITQGVPCQTCVYMRAQMTTVTPTDDDPFDGLPTADDYPNR